MKSHLARQIVIIGAGILVVLLIALWGHFVPSGGPAARRAEEAIWAAHMGGAGQNAGKLEITYPLDETLFPPEIAEPTFRWHDDHAEADTWLVRVEPADGQQPIEALTHTAAWTPSPDQWQSITRGSVDSPAKVTVLGVSQSAPEKLLSSAMVRISTSKDEVGAPLFYREVDLPFHLAVTDPAKHIRWRFGPISSREPAPVILDNMPVCANCHSFSADGKQLGMDVDYANDKGSYLLAPVEHEIVMDPGKIMTWTDYRREDNEPTFGFLSQVSPDGRYVVSTVKDRSVFVARPNLDFSQLFFPIKGIMVVYDLRAKTFAPLPGADDPQYVQASAAWSPDGRELVFCRAKAHQLRGLSDSGAVLLSVKECAEFLEGGKTFQYDLYRVPFNGGKGGQAVPIPGASDNGMSNFFPRYSPDGKWIVFCRAKSYMLLQPDSELYIMPAAGGQPRRLRCNTSRMNSWHTFSPNGRWLVFSSKLNGPYTQLMLTHIDEEGNSTPPVVLDRLTDPKRAANIPEFVNAAGDAIHKIREQFTDDHSHWRAGLAFVQGGDFKGAERMFRTAIEMNPRSIESHTSLGSLLMQTGQAEEGLKQLTTALELDPNSAAGHTNLASALVEAGRVPEAIAQYERASELNPKDCEADKRLAWLLATRDPQQEGDAARAISLAQHACQLTENRSADCLNVLAAAYASAGRFSEAIDTAQKALERANTAGQAQLAQRIEDRLKVYRAGRSHDGPAP